LKGEGDRILRQTKEIAPKSDEEEEGTIGVGVGMMYWRLIAVTDLVLELQADVEIQSVSQI
jgi:hypothetical protein